jgi:hypothetical protein
VAAGTEGGLGRLMGADARYRLPGTVLRAQLETSDVLLDTSSGLYHLLSGSGPRILEELHAGATVESVITGLADRTDAEPERIRRDVTSFVDSLVRQGLLEPRP